MKSFGLFIHHKLRESQSVFELLDHLRRSYGYAFIGECEQENLLPNFVKCYDWNAAELPKIDAILVFGGDGTILRAKKLALATGAPLLGINLGYLGFLSETTLAEIQSSLETLDKGKYKLLTRMLLDAKVQRGRDRAYQGLALNDAVIYKAATPRLINVRLFNNKRYVFDARCDGFIASTPTGSTAYSLAAGGPILVPEMNALILSPINPHLLSVRPMVFQAQDKLIMRVYNMDEPACLQIDGVNSLYLEEQDEVHVTASSQTVSFIKLSQRSFYRILRTKLHLGK